MCPDQLDDGAVQPPIPSLDAPRTPNSPQNTSSRVPTMTTPAYPGPLCHSSALAPSASTPSSFPLDTQNACSAALCTLLRRRPFFRARPPVAAVGGDFPDDFRKVLPPSRTSTSAARETRAGSKTFRLGRQVPPEHEHLGDVFHRAIVPRRSRPGAPLPSPTADSSSANPHPGVQLNLLSQIKGQAAGRGGHHGPVINIAKAGAPGPPSARLDGLVFNYDEAELPPKVQQRLRPPHPRDGPPLRRRQEGGGARALSSPTAMASSALPAFPAETVIDPTGRWRQLCGRHGAMGSSQPAHPLTPVH